MARGRCDTPRTTWPRQVSKPRRPRVLTKVPPSRASKGRLGSPGAVVILVPCPLGTALRSGGGDETPLRGPGTGTPSARAEHRPHRTGPRGHAPGTPLIRRPGRRHATHPHRGDAAPEVAAPPRGHCKTARPRDPGVPGGPPPRGHASTPPTRSAPSAAPLARDHSASQSPPLPAAPRQSDVSYSPSEGGAPAGRCGCCAGLRRPAPGLRPSLTPRTWPQSPIMALRRSSPSSEAAQHQEAAAPEPRRPRGRASGAACRCSGTPRCSPSFPSRAVTSLTRYSLRGTGSAARRGVSGAERAPRPAISAQNAVRGRSAAGFTTLMRPTPRTAFL